MTRITNADQVLLLLRSHLQRAERMQRRPSTTSPRAEKRTPLRRVQDIANAEDLTDEDLGRALLAGILAEEFGSDLVNDPKLQQVVNDILAMLSRDRHSSRLVAKALAQLTETKR